MDNFDGFLKVLNLGLFFTIRAAHFMFLNQKVAQAYNSFLGCYIMRNNFFNKIFEGLTQVQAEGKIVKYFSW